MEAPTVPRGWGMERGVTVPLSMGVWERAVPSPQKKNRF